jgi:hypothetical protein
MQAPNNTGNTITIPAQALQADFNTHFQITTVINDLFHDGVIPTPRDHDSTGFRDAAVA